MANLKTLWALLLLTTLASAAEPTGAVRAYPPLPEAVSSFGATVAGQWVYIFGGHMGCVPGNSKDGLSPAFARLDLSSPDARWEELPMLESSQSPGLVAWKGMIYRVGGLSFHNAASEPTDYHSLDLFARFDPATKSWTKLPSLPAPRSSLDAAVVDGKLYVVGGWNLQGPNVQDAPWHEDALVFDLADEKGAWRPIAKPPFQTRALAAAPCAHKLYILGGMKSSNQTTNEVHVYDPATDQWSKGPELATSGTFGGFALSAFGADDKLYFSGGSGTVYQLNASSDGWKPIERLLYSRMFHRLVIGPAGEIVVLGGVAGRVYLANVESVSPARTPGPKLTAWDIEFGGQARHSQALVLSGSTLYAFGGNHSPAPHDFDKKNFSTEAFAFDLPSQKVETLAPLPQPMQSGAAFVGGTRLDPSVFIVGGLSPGAERFGPTAAIQQYRLRSKSWNEDLKQLPAARSMFELGVYRNAAWIFGGSAGADLATDTWTWNPVDDRGIEVIPEAAVPTPRRSFAGIVLGNKYYVVGGLGEKAKVADKSYAFDFEAKTWSEIASPKESRVFAQLAMAGGKLYLSGGFALVDGHFAGATAIEMYDPQTNAWTTVFEELAPKLSKMRLLSYQDRLLFFSVDADKAGLAHFVLLDPTPQTDGYGAPPSQGEDRTSGQEVATQLKTLDKNGDGQVTLDEVGPRFQPLVKRIDANSDGIASKEEIAAFTKKLDDDDKAAQAAGGRPGAGGPGAGGRPPRTGDGAAPKAETPATKSDRPAPKAETPPAKGTR